MQGEVVASAEAAIAVATFERLCSSVFPVKIAILVQITSEIFENLPQMCDFYQIQIEIPVVARQLIRPGESPFAAIPTAAVRLLA